MLVEDDNSLREIYQARLMAEGYQIVSAKDGEEALALVGHERPDLIILDVMMPKISGFDTLDILRSTPTTSNTKVIMMSALSQAEDKTRAEKLGANKYLVKSQVTLEDIVKAVKEVLESDGAASPAAPANPVMPQTAPTQPGQISQAPNIPVYSQPSTSQPVATQAESPLNLTPPALQPTETTLSQPSESATQPQPLAEPPASSFGSPSPTLTPPPSAPAPSSFGTSTTVAIPSSDDGAVASDPNPLNSATPSTQPTSPPPSAPAPSSFGSSSTVAISGSDTIAPPRAGSPPTANDTNQAAATVDSASPTVADAPQTVGGTKVIVPLNDEANTKSRLDDLLAAEAAKESAPTSNATPPPPDASQPPPPQTA